MRSIVPRATVSAAFGLLLGMPLPTAAHDLWITTMSEGGQTRAVVNFGHPDDRSLPYLEKLVSLDVVSSVGHTSMRNVKFEEGRLKGAAVLITPAFTLPVGAKLMTAVYDNGYFIKTADGERNTSRRLAPTGTDSIWAPKFTKTLLGPGAYATVMGHELELVPVEDPFTRPAGQALHVKVLFRGKPLAGEKVELGDGNTPVADADIPRFVTDAQGIATLPLPTSGEVLLTVDHSVPGANPALAVTDFYNASLDFVLR